MADKTIADAVAWRPEWSADDEGYIRRRLDDIADEVRMFRRMRQAFGLNQVEAAKILGITQSGMSRIEARGGGDLNALAKMARATGRHVKVVISEAEGDEMSFRVA